MATTRTTTRKKASPKKTATKKAPARKTAAKKTTAKPKAAKKSDKKLGALDAAAKVLGETKKPMTSKELIEAMAKKKYWTSPSGKTPHSTLYAAILREINAKGKDARFKKVERGTFAVNK